MVLTIRSQIIPPPVWQERAIGVLLYLSEISPTFGGEQTGDGIMACIITPLRAFFMTKKRVKSGMRRALVSLLTMLIFISQMDERSWAEMKAADPEKLEAHLKKIVGERTPHLSDGHLHDVFQYIKKTLEHLEYEIELDPFLFEGETYENIIARKRGVRSSGRIIVGAHFDSVPGSPGADDNASGVAALLELARILRDRKWNNTVEFIGFHMEEWYMVGSKAYVEKLKKSKVNVRGMVPPPVYRPGRPIPLSEEKQVVGMVSLEMVGFTSEERE